MSEFLYDFSGWATKNDLKCSDGRTIRRDAFKHNDGSIVPLVWNHQHDGPMNVLGKALLENRPEGVYAYCEFNDTPAGQTAMNLVCHGDVDALSIYANQLKQIGGDVIHGMIREVSIVLAGANPGALIDDLPGDDLEHSDGGYCDQVIIYTGERLCLSHADGDSDAEADEADEEDAEIEDEDEEEDEEEEMNYPEDVTVEEVYDTFTDEEKDAVEAVIAMYVADREGELEQADESDFFMHADEDSIADIIDNMDETKRAAAMAIIGGAVEAIENGEVDDEDEDEEDYEESDEEDEEEEMAHNVFDNDEYYDGSVLSHSDEAAIFDNAMRIGSLRKAVEMYSEDTGNELVLRHDGTDPEPPTYGIENINYLFPDAHVTTPTPIFIKRPTEWVSKFMGRAKHTPFSRLKSIYADITAEEARAKGYVTGARKAEEVFRLLNRTTDPTTVYKKQKLDRDNVQDITSFEVVGWLKGEMRMMLDEEIARAALTGDGRVSGADKINELCIRPIWTDDDLFTIKYRMEIPADATDDIIATTLVRSAVKSRKTYRGTGNPIFFTTEDNLTRMLLKEDLNGHVIYEDEQKLARALRCSEIVAVPTMDNLTRTVTTTGGSETRTLEAIIVNPADYTFGADHGGQIGMFEDFDLDYNAMLYLMEARTSGSLLLPYSAIVLESVVAD